MLAIIKIGIDPVAFSIGALAVHWYGIMYVVAFAVAYYLGARAHCLPRGISRAHIEQITGWTILFGLIGGRLYYDVQTLSLMKSPIDWIAVWQGGMAFYGAIVLGVGTIIFLGWRWRLPVWVLLDGGAFFAAVGQPIGRIGNIINGDILGGPSNLPWATAYTNPHAVLQSTPQLTYAVCTPAHCQAYQPAGAYEGLATLCILAILILMRRRQVRAGVIFIAYVALYSVSQFGLDFLRQSEPITWAGLKELQITALIAFIFVLPALIVAWRRTAGRPASPAMAQGAEEDGREDAGTGDAIPAAGDPATT